MNLQYLLDLEIDGTESNHLADAIEDEPFPLTDLIGIEAVQAQIRDGRLLFETQSDERLPWFKDAIEILSVYVSSYVTGIELLQTHDEDGKRHIEILKYVGRKGDVIAVPLTHTIEFPSGDIVPGHEDIGHLEKNWTALPRWAQDAYRLKFPVLRRL